MNLQKFYYSADDSKYLKWDSLTKENPLRFKLTGEPEKRMFQGKPTYEFQVAVPGGARKVLTLSQRALNTLVEAGHKHGHQDAMHKVVWTAWKEGDKFDTTYHFVPATSAPGAPAPTPAPAPITMPPQPQDFETFDSDEDDMPF